MEASYDSIGKGYINRRTPEPAIEKAIHARLGEARTVLNIGAGSGSYEPQDREVIAVEPSLTMISQRRPDAASVIMARAEALPFRSKSFDLSMAARVL